ncbi:transketolase [Nanoarchaeota archaeon]
MKKVTDIKKLKLISKEIRRDIIKMLTEAKSGHPAGALGMADVFTALYFNVMNHNPKKPWWPERDRFILSNGHICPVWYATLANAGYFPKKELMTLRKINSRLQGHPHIHSAPGIENTSGPLGQGISVAVGMALAARLDNKKYNVFCGISDAELQEGQTWEALMFAGNPSFKEEHTLDNLIVVLDRNFIQISGSTEIVMPLEPLKKKLEAFKWRVLEINGHNMHQVVSILDKSTRPEKCSCEECKTCKTCAEDHLIRKPTMIICNTIPGAGVSFMEGKPEWHGKPPSPKEAKKALKELK